MKLCLPKFAQRLSQVVDHEAVVVGEEVVPHLRDFPSRQIEMQAVDEGHVVADHRRHRLEQVPCLNHDVDRLVRVAEHGHARFAGRGLLPALVLPGFAVGLHRRDDFLRHLLQVRDLVEADDVPDLDQSFRAPAHVAEQVRDRRRTGHEGRVRRNFLDDVALAGAPGPQFDEVVIPLAQGNEAGQEQELQAPRHLRRLVAHAAHGEVDPLVRRELGPLALVLLQVEGGDLDRGQLVDPERVLALAFLVVGEPHLDLGPDAAGQQAFVVADVVGRDVDELVAEIAHLGPVVGIRRGAPSPCR